MHANVCYRPTLPYQPLTHIEGRGYTNGFHDNIKAVDLWVKVLAGCLSDVGNSFH